MFKEKLLSSIENLNGTTSARYTARNINAMFVLMIVIGGGIFGSVFAFFSPDDEYTQCIEDYTKQVDEVRQRNEELVSSCYKEYKDNIYELGACIKNPTPVPVNSCTNKWTWSLREGESLSDVPSRQVENNLRKRFGLESCRATNDFHRLGKYNLEWIGYDIACEVGKSFDVKSPWDYTIEKIGFWYNIGNFIILVKWNTSIVLWHTATSRKVWDKLKEWDVIGQTDISWASTWMHVHIELWDNYYNVSREFALWEKYRKINGTALLNHRQWDFGQQKENVYYFTSYDLWDESQNDSTPCIGASGKDLCALEKSGVRTMALTSDIREKLGVRFGDKVRLLWDEGCEWVYEVHDEMNKRFRQTPWILRPGTPYYIKWDLPSKDGWVCSVTKI